MPKHLILIVFILSSSNTKAQQEIVKSPERQQKIMSCYTKFPIILKTLALTSDLEFQSHELAQSRKKEFAQFSQQSPAETKQCLDLIIDAAKEEPQKFDFDYVKLRLADFL